MQAPNATPTNATTCLARAATRIVAVSAVGCAMAGCAPVSAASRGYLAKPEMKPGGDPHEEAFHSHIEAAREGGMGGHGGQGGGCGCG